MNRSVRRPPTSARIHSFTPPGLLVEYSPPWFGFTLSFNGFFHGSLCTFSIKHHHKWPVILRAQPLFGGGRTTSSKDHLPTQHYRLMASLVWLDHLPSASNALWSHLWPSLKAMVDFIVCPPQVLQSFPIFSQSISHFLLVPSSSKPNGFFLSRCYTQLHRVSLTLGRLCLRNPADRQTNEKTEKQTHGS